MRSVRENIKKLNKNKWLYTQKTLASITILTMIATMIVFVPPSGIEKAEAGNTDVMWTSQTDFTNNAVTTSEATTLSSAIDISGDSVSLQLLFFSAN